LTASVDLHAESPTAEPTSFGLDRPMIRQVVGLNLLGTFAEEIGRSRISDPS
jgi:hypothetical protein